MLCSSLLADKIPLGNAILYIILDWHFHRIHLLCYSWKTAILSHFSMKVTLAMNDVLIENETPARKAPEWNNHDMIGYYETVTVEEYR